MIGFLRKLWKDRRGNALIIAGASMPLIVGAAGLGSDSIQWVLWKRELQRAADSAAFSGVYAKIQGIDVNADCSVTSPVGRDLTINNHVRVGNNNTSCTVENSPSSGAYASDSNAVRVNLAVQKRLGFSSMFLATAPTISASATATVVPDGEYCVVSLENTSATGITASGSATVDMGCGMITNSTSLTAAVATGSSSVTASPIAAVGGIDGSNNWGSGTVLQPFTLAQEDPFKNVTAPAPSGCQKFSSYDTGNNNKPGGIVDLTNSASMPAGGTYCISEGSGTLNIQGDVRLPKGTYVLDATSLKMSNTSARLSCTECTFVLTSSTADTNPGSIGNVNMNGGQLNLEAPHDGPFQGIMFYQDRRALNNTGTSYQNLINGNSASTLQGAVYFPNQTLTFNGTAGMTTQCLQLVSRTVSYSGNLNISNSCPANSGASAFTGKKVRLVG